MKKARGTPIMISQSGYAALERHSLEAKDFSEAWLQQLIFDHPGLLPIAEIEPGFGTPFSVAREVPCGHGYIDNLYVTPSGEIVLVEAKLWRNVQARREVVAQALDYVAALMGLGYAGFEAAILKGAMAEPRPAHLYALVAQSPDALSEAEFIDAVSRNLDRGRMLVMVLGDGIRQEAEALARLLQGHAGAHFTFALVELSIWRNASGGELVVVPTTLAQTLMIERGVVRLVEGAAVVAVPDVAPAAKGQSLTAAMFFETIAAKDPALPAALRAFIERLEPLGVYPDFKASLNLKVDLPEGSKPLNLASIAKNGQVWTSYVEAAGPRHLAVRYAEILAGLIGGCLSMSDGVTVTTNGKSAPFLGAFLPQHAAAWEGAVRDLLVDVGRATERAA